MTKSKPLGIGPTLAAAAGRPGPPNHLGGPRPATTTGHRPTDKEMTMTKFSLTAASVHYGSTRYPLNGLEAEWAEVTGVEEIDLDELAWAVERLTGFLRPFE